MLNVSEFLMVSSHGFAFTTSYSDDSDDECHKIPASSSHTESVNAFQTDLLANLSKVLASR